MKLGKYQLVRKLATGGMAEVFLARAEGPMGFTKALVVKRILPHLVEDPQFVEMFIAEARLAAQLDHPNIVQIFDFGEADGTWFLAMEYIDGMNLRVLSKRARVAGIALPPICCARIIAGACEGLAFAHNSRDPDTGVPLGLIHRDISPDNILLSRQGAVKVVDFGIAKAANQEHRTRTGTIKGKVAYMPPEQLRGAELDRRVDVYALGMVLYELLTGHKPFDASTEASIVQAILYEPFVPAEKRQPDLPVALRHILERALAKEREQRYADCVALQADLERFMVSTGEPVGTSHLAHLMNRVVALTEAAVTEPIPGYTPGKGTPGKGTPGRGTPSRDTSGKTTPARGTPGKGVHGLQQQPRTAMARSAARPPKAPPPKSPRKVDPPSESFGRQTRFMAVGVGALVLLVLGVGLSSRREALASTPPALSEPAVPTPPPRTTPRTQRTTPEPAPVTAPSPKAEEQEQTTAPRPVTSVDETPVREVASTEKPMGAEASTEPRATPSTQEPEHPEPVARNHPSKSEPGRKKPRAVSPAPPPPVTPEPVSTNPKTGTVEFRIRPYATVWLDGKNIGQTPLEHLELAVGRHTVRLVNEDLGKNVTLRFDVRVGETYTLKHNLSAE